MSANRRLAVGLALALCVGGSAEAWGTNPRPAATDGVGAARSARIIARPVKTGLQTPAAFTVAPSGRIFYGELSTGVINVLVPATGATHRFFRIPNVVSSPEQGLLGIAVQKGFPDQSPFLYAYASRKVNGGVRNQILRIKSANGKGVSMRVIFTSATTSNAYHDGGHIAFGPDGSLYTMIGESHHAANAQDLSVPSGKILRMTTDGGIPKNPPLPGTRIYSYGHRNSFGFDFDPKTGRLWESENGPQCNDELNRVIPGRNYGWGPSQTCSTPPNPPRGTNRDGPSPVLPLRWYTPTIAPTGLVFCSKCGLGPASNGKLFFGAYNTGDIRRVRLTSNRLDVASQAIVYTHSSGILSMEAGPDGHLFFSDSQGIYRLTLS
jgi:glucose/arabinose dehydrogenase